MVDLRLKATFCDSDKEIEFNLSDIICSMGTQCAEDVSLANEIGSELAFLAENIKKADFEIIKAIN